MTICLARRLACPEAALEKGKLHLEDTEATTIDFVQARLGNPIKSHVMLSGLF